MPSAARAARWLAGLVILGAAALGGGPAGAADVEAAYAIHWHGLEVGRLEAELARDGERYRLAWRGQAVGLIGALFPFEHKGESEGRREGSGFASERFSAWSAWRDGGGAWEVAFAPGGRVERVELPPGAAEGREPVPENLRVGPDPAALLLTALLAAAPGARLEGKSFDGKRVVHFALACEGAAPVAAGGELPCTVEGRLLAGASRRWRAEGEGEGEARRGPTRVWLAVGAGGGWWPVRVEVPTRFGPVEARLVRLGSHPHMAVEPAG